MLFLRETGGSGIGGVEGETFGDGLSFGDHSQPLPGLVLRPEDGTVQVVAEFRAPSKVRLQFTDAVLRFSVNDGTDEEESFPASGLVCFDSPRPSGCE